MAENKKIKDKIIAEIESLAENEQEAVLGIVENYIHGQIDEVNDWNEIPVSWKKRIEESLQQGDNGQIVLNEDAVAYIRKKYGLNG